VSWWGKILDEIVAEEIAALPADMQPRFLRLADRIASRGSIASASHMLISRCEEQRKSNDDRV
jgi:hypothetical protein